MLPHEKALVKRLQDKPFALLGINNDGPAAEVLAKFQKEGITWRNAIEPDKDSLASKWNVSGYPNLYLVDAQGVIRDHWLGSPGDEVLDQRIDELVAEAQKK
ncbi:MAG: TlpA family protein disulfide reductase [Planctomycetes bacterium]|nr:TlpA family protein disulfide reductase [Planctomycetota bacterium]